MHAKADHCASIYRQMKAKPDCSISCYRKVQQIISICVKRNCGRAVIYGWSARQNPSRKTKRWSIHGVEVEMHGEGKAFKKPYHQLLGLQPGWLFPSWNNQTGMFGGQHTGMVMRKKKILFLSSQHTIDHYFNLSLKRKHPMQCMVDGTFLVWQWNVNHSLTVKKISWCADPLESQTAGWFNAF